MDAVMSDFRLMPQPAGSAANHAVPVPLRTTYTVMGRFNQMWETILPSTDDLHTARRTMDAANTSRRFNRIVITQGNAINHQWTTIECAMPLNHAQYRTMLRGLKSKTANANVSKESQNFLLGFACALGTMLQSPQALIFVACLALIDCLYLADRQRLTPKKTRRFNRQRNWAYSLLNGCLLVLLILKHLPL